MSRERCCVQSCRSTRWKGCEVSFHSFPSANEMRSRHLAQEIHTDSFQIFLLLLIAFDSAFFFFLEDVVPWQSGYVRGMKSMKMTGVNGPLTRSGHFELTNAVHTICANDCVCKVLHHYVLRKELKFQTKRRASISSGATHSQPESQR